MSGKQSRAVHLALAWLRRHPGQTAAAAERYGCAVKSVRLALHAAGRSDEVMPVGRPRKSAAIQAAIEVGKSHAADKFAFPTTQEQTP